MEKLSGLPEGNQLVQDDLSGVPSPVGSFQVHSAPSPVGTSPVPELHVIAFSFFNIDVHLSRSKAEVLSDWRWLILLAICIVLTLINGLLFYGVAKFQQQRYRRGSRFWCSWTCAYLGTISALFTLLVWLAAAWIYVNDLKDLSALVGIEGADVLLLAGSGVLMFFIPPASSVPQPDVNHPVPIEEPDTGMNPPVQVPAQPNVPDGAIGVQPPPQQQPERALPVPDGAIGVQPPPQQQPDGALPVQDEPQPKRMEDVV